MRNKSPMDFQSAFRGKVVVVVGGTSGIGKQVVCDLNQLGAHLIVVGKDDTKLKALRNDIDNIDTINIDVSKRNKCIVLANDIKKKQTRIDNLVVSAGIFEPGSIEDTDSNIWDKSLNINLSAVFWVIKSLYELLCKSNQSSIVVVSSILAHYGSSVTHAYCAAKGGLSALVKSMAIELSNSNVRINSVSPGHVDTKMIEEIINDNDKRVAIEKLYPLKRIGKTTDISALIIFLLSNYSSWITGSDYIIDGGRSAQV
ncbi:MAG: SDR family oxidoreductase [Bacteroidales bacterium]|nr:SDR family oxidoreductase [Candidatus Latescibacterota bacterium]